MPSEPARSTSDRTPISGDAPDGVEQESCASVRIRALEASDEDAAVAALTRAFDLAPDAPLRVPGAWRRRYFENPAGTRAMVAVDAAGRVLAQYAGLPQDAWIDGERTTITQGVDSLADPELGRGLGSLFVRVGKRFAQDHGGRLGDGDPFMWGYPVREAWRIGRRLLGYATIRSQLALVARVDDLREGNAAGVRVQEVTGFPAELDEWFASFRARYAAICERTRSTLAWRYEGQPQRRYRIALASVDGELRGLAVGRAVVLEGARRFALCEWLVDDATRGALLGWAAGAAREEGTDELYAWLPPWCDDFLALQHAGFRVHPTSRVLVGHSYDRRRPAEWYAANWFTTLGDTDLL